MSKSNTFPDIMQLKYSQKMMGPCLKKHQLCSIFINRGCEPSFYDPIFLLIFNYHNELNKRNCNLTKDTELQIRSYFD